MSFIKPGNSEFPIDITIISTITASYMDQILKNAGFGTWLAHYEFKLKIFLGGRRYVEKYIK